ncbi:hypothetical protein G9A89_016238 [Geosiphon pyriformis]|nr:hypothetical protein G9A89_016238 [Geosiphon pyriformis]
MKKALKNSGFGTGVKFVVFKKKKKSGALENSITKNVKILVNTDLKKSSGHSNWTVVVKNIPVRTSIKTVHAALSEFGVIKSIKMQLVGLWQKAIIKFKQVDQANLAAAKWSILIGKDTACVAKANMDKES